MQLDYGGGRAGGRRCKDEKVIRGKRASRAEPSRAVGAHVSTRLEFRVPEFARHHELLENERFFFFFLSFARTLSTNNNKFAVFVSHANSLKDE